MAVLAVTGGGVTLLTDLLNVPGASRTVLEAIVPYADRALSDWVGAAIDGAVRPETARDIAEAALARARALVTDATVPLVGLGITATLVTDRPKRGEHRAELAVALPSGGYDQVSVVLERGRRTRDEEDRVVADLALLLLARAAGVDPAPLDEEAPGLGLGPGDRLEPDLRPTRPPSA